MTMLVDVGLMDFVFLKQKTAYELRISDWSSDVCSSDLVGQAFRAVNPDVRLFAMEPSESQTILCGEISTHHIEGISDGFVPGIFARHSELVDSTLSVSSEEAIAEMRQLARGHGLLCGPSSGAHLIAARRVREQHPEF